MRVLLACNVLGLLLSSVSCTPDLATGSTQLPPIELDGFPVERKQDLAVRWTNDGSRTVSVEGLKPSCACLVLTVGEESVQPGATLTVFLSLRKSKPGTFEHTYFVKLSDGRYLNGSVSGECHAKPRMDPQNLAWHLTRGETKFSAASVLRVDGIDGFVLEKVYSSSSGLTVETQIESRGSQNVVIVVEGSLPLNRTSEQWEVYARYSLGGREAEERLGVRVVRESTVRFSPPGVILSGATGTKARIAVSTGATPLSAMQIQCSPNRVARVTVDDHRRTITIDQVEELTSEFDVLVHHDSIHYTIPVTIVP